MHALGAYLHVLVSILLCDTFRTRLVHSQAAPYAAMLDNRTHVKWYAQNRCVHMA